MTEAFKRGYMDKMAEWGASDRSLAGAGLGALVGALVPSKDKDGKTNWLRNALI